MMNNNVVCFFLSSTSQQKMWLGRSTLGGVAIPNEGFLLTKRNLGMGRTPRRGKDAGRQRWTAGDSERRSKEEEQDELNVGLKLQAVVVWFVAQDLKQAVK